MKIIKKGGLPAREKKTYTGECFDCGCLVEFKGYEGELCLDSINEQYSIKCPTDNCRFKILGEIKP